MKKGYLTIIFALILSSFTEPSNNPSQEREQWVAKKMANMTINEKIGQLFMIRAHSDKGPEHIAQIEAYIRQYQVGGLCFFQGTVEKQVELTNSYQNLSKIPLLIGIDGEWGLGMRFPKTEMSFPKQLMLGAIQDNHLIYEMGEEIAYQMKRVGVHVNFAPVADVNNNSKNPVINDRSFGENPDNVASKSYAYMKGMQDNKVMASAKHFPGHGDTGVDSHFDLPIIPHNKERLDSIELVPFELLINQGIESIMVAHLHVPAIDNKPNMPISLSYAGTTGLLRDSFKFNGLIFTDGLEMQGVTKNFPPGELEAKAILAGNDMLLLPPDLPRAFNTIKKYVDQGKISMERINQSVERILIAKYNHGLTTTPQIMLNDLSTDTKRPKAIALKKRLITNAITLTRDADGNVPLKLNPGSKIACLSIGSVTQSEFQKEFAKNATIDQLNLAGDFPESKISETLNKLKSHHTVVVGIHGMNKSESKKFGIGINTIKLISALNKQNKVITVIFGNPYSLEYFDNINSVIVAYDEDVVTQEIAAKGILGEININGKLPVSAGKSYKYGDGLERRAQMGLGFSTPENVGISSDSLLGIEKIVNEMIAAKAAPGCQIFIAKDGKVIYNNSFGHHTYDNKDLVKNTDLYDLASITKIAATTLAIMKLNEEGKLNIGSSLSQYITQLDTTNKKDLKIYDIMAHHAGLIGWIPFYKSTISNGKYPKPLPEYYSSKSDASHQVKVADNLFLRTDYMDSLWNKIYSSELRDNHNYKYSDLGFYLLSKAVQDLTGTSFDQYMAKTFYEPLGLERMMFNPLEKYSKDEVVPSENDSYFRGEKIQGYVHDMGSAMLGGVSGHAGLFSNAYELGVVMQMLLNGGYYGNTQFLKPETINLFTQRHPLSTRRGIGFDMKEINPSKYQNVSEKASDNTFGHTGFTGTYAFVDPDYNLVFVMLANRTYPSMNNNKFIRGKYRERIHTLIYGAMGVQEKTVANNN